VTFQILIPKNLEMARIGVDARLLELKTSGIGRYVFHLLDHISRQDRANEYFLFSYSALEGLPGYWPFVNVPTVRGRPGRFSQKVFSPLWMNFVLPHFVNKLGIELFFSPNHFLPLRRLKCKTVIAVHDVFHKVDTSFHPFLYRKYVDLLLPISLRHSDCVITVSRSSKNDIQKYFGVADDKLHVIYLGVDEALQETRLTSEEYDRVRKRYSLPDEFILYIGVIENRKNIEAVLAVADIMKGKSAVPLLLFGRLGHDGRLLLRKITSRDNVAYKGFVEERDLPIVFKLAKAFFFPTFYEGFGLPVLEAMKCGVPVVTSNTSSIPEIVGQSALTYSPTDYQGFAEALLSILADSDLRSRMITNELERAKSFGWEKNAAETIRVFNNIVGHC